ncbi:MAG: protein phosphatase 2C domain-containing protein [Muribaculaceae bacterium]|nr:protein phosphatase 2C domain-containing protein [Muribaculaceae bacterium]
MIFNSTVIGASHNEAGKECQDYSMTWQNRSGSIKIAAVSDGHGGEDYYNSALGSRLACKVALDAMKEVALSVRNISPGQETRLVKTVCSSILARWNEAVDDLRGRDPVKSFGCTLIAYLQTREYWIGLQIGDGKFVTLQGVGKWSQPVPWDDRCILNYTTSMCDEDALNEFRFAVGHNRPDAVFLASDGIDTTFEDGELLYNFFNHILESARHEGRRRICDGLPDMLSHFSEVGSRDDMSVAAIINR